MDVEPAASEATLFRVEQAMRFRGLWEEIAFSHWGRPLLEVQDALEEAGRRWGIASSGDDFATAAMHIHCGLL